MYRSSLSYCILVLTTISTTATAFSFVSSFKTSISLESSSLDDGISSSKLCMVANDIGINGETAANGGRRKKTKQVCSHNGFLLRLNLFLWMSSVNLNKNSFSLLYFLGKARTGVERTTSSRCWPFNPPCLC